jgi:hypothetical protein
MHDGGNTGRGSDPEERRKHSGLSPSEAEALLVQACERAVASRVSYAVGDLLDALAEEPEQWVVTEPVEILLPPDVPRLVVGRTTHTARPQRLAIGQELARKQGFVPPFATARVVSRGATTARALARQAFAESAATLDVVAPPANTGSEATLARRTSDPPGAPGFTHPGWFFGTDMISGGRLAPPFLYLSRAAARDEATRSDWQRRALGAARCFSRGHRSESAADRLVSAMVALECLFIVGREEPQKGTLIAERVTERYRRRDMTKAEQTAWLQGLYRIRNDAAHEGREVLDDLEVDRLLDLTRFIVRVSAFHLDPEHREPQRACRTYAQAMRCRGRPQEACETPCESGRSGRLPPARDDRPPNRATRPFGPQAAAGEHRCETSGVLHTRRVAGSIPAAPIFPLARFTRGARASRAGGGWSWDLDLADTADGRALGDVVGEEPERLLLGLGLDRPPDRVSAGAARREGRAMTQRAPVSLEGGEDDAALLRVVAMLEQVAGHESSFARTGCADIGASP